jgi:hypothetical protein
VRSLTWRKGGRLTDGIIEDEDDDEAHSHEESSHGETCVGPMILWMSMARTKTLINYQKRVSNMKRTDSEDVEALKMGFSACMYVFQDVIWSHLQARQRYL